MSSTDLLESEVMQKSPSVLNDTTLSVYTYSAQLPYLRIAVDELQEYFQLHDLAVTQLTSTIINVPVGQIQCSLPSDLIEPQEVYERAEGIDPFVKMTRKEYLPHYLESVPLNRFVYYVWQGQVIKFPVSVRNNDLKIDYIRQLFSTIVDENTQINIINAKTFLEYRTASLCAEFIERNLASSASLNNYAMLALDRTTGISIKGKQNIMTRRRPFRAGWKRG